MRAFRFVTPMILALGLASSALAGTTPDSAVAKAAMQAGKGPPPQSTPVAQSCYWSNFTKAYKLSGQDFELAHGTACGICKMKC